jgi:enoyl-CoA hydratase/carnithine racemase
VPRPRLHLIRFHGALAPNAKLRAEIVPREPLNTADPCNDHAHTAHGSTPTRISWARTRQHAMYQAVRDLDKPCIAALAGVAAGAGFQIALCCDLRIGYPELKIGQPEIRAGLASIVGSYLMTLHVGLAHNVELSLAAKLLSGTRAYELGLVNELVSREKFSSAPLPSQSSSPRCRRWQSG